MEMFPLWTAIDFVRCSFGSHRLIPTEANGHRPTDAGFQEMPYIPLKSPLPIDLCRMRTPSGDKHSNGSTVHLQRQWAKIICKWSGTITLWIWQVNRNVHEWMVKEKRRIVDDRKLNEVKKKEIEWRRKKRTITKLFTFRAYRPYVEIVWIAAVTLTFKHRLNQIKMKRYTRAQLTHRRKLSAPSSFIRLKIALFFFYRARTAFRWKNSVTPRSVAPFSSVPFRFSSSSSIRFPFLRLSISPRHSVFSALRDTPRLRLSDSPTLRNSVFPSPTLRLSETPSFRLRLSLSGDIFPVCNFTSFSCSSRRHFTVDERHKNVLLPFDAFRPSSQRTIRRFESDSIHRLWHSGGVTFTWPPSLQNAEDKWQFHAFCITTVIKMRLLIIDASGYFIRLNHHHHHSEECSRQFVWYNLIGADNFAILWHCYGCCDGR